MKHAISRPLASTLIYAAAISTLFTTYPGAYPVTKEIMSGEVYEKRNNANFTEWKPWRFFVERNQLVYYSLSKPKKNTGEPPLPQGTIGLRDARVGSLHYDADRPFVVVIMTATRIYYVAASSEEQQQALINELLALKLLNVRGFDPAELFGSIDGQDMPSLTQLKRKDSATLTSAVSVPAPHSFERKVAAEDMKCAHYFCQKNVNRGANCFICSVCNKPYHVQCAQDAAFNCLSMKSFYDPTEIRPKLTDRSVSSADVESPAQRVPIRRVATEVGPSSTVKAADATPPRKASVGSTLPAILSPRAGPPAKALPSLPPSRPPPSIAPTAPASTAPKVSLIISSDPSKARPSRPAPQAGARPVRPAPRPGSESGSEDSPSPRAVPAPVSSQVPPVAPAKSSSPAAPQKVAAVPSPCKSAPTNAVPRPVAQPPKNIPPQPSGPGPVMARRPSQPQAPQNIVPASTNTGTAAAPAQPPPPAPAKSHTRTRSRSFNNLRNVPLPTDPAPEPSPAPSLQLKASHAKHQSGNDAPRKRTLSSSSKDKKVVIKSPRDEEDASATAGEEKPKRKDSTGTKSPRKHATIDKEKSKSRKHSDAPEPAAVSSPPSRLPPAGPPPAVPGASTKAPPRVPPKRTVVPPKLIPVEPQLIIGDDEEIDLDELDEMQRFLAELGISVTDTKTAIRATLILRQFEGGGVPKEDLRKTLSFSETQSIDLDSLQDLLSAFGSEGGDEDQRLSVLIGGSSQ